MSPSRFLSRNPRSSGLLAVVALGLVLVLGAFLNTRADDKKPAMKDAPATTGTPAEQARKAEQLKKLTPEQFHVTQESGTEPAFHNAYWNNHRPGIYVDVVTGEPLFSSTDKFESGTGWPSFTKPIQKEAVVEKTDRAYGMTRTEVRSRQGDCHLGHVFDDGPAPTGLRYCMNSAALRFIPADKLKEEGYGQFAALFEPAHQATAQADTKK